MADKKKTAPKKTAKAVKPAKTFSVNLQKPGSLPEVLKVKAGVKLSDIIENRSLQDYQLSVNGHTESPSYTLVKDDVIRVGLPTKNK
jgi:hypothetical protein